MSTILPFEENLDPRVKRTRALIDQAFAQVLAEKGFQAATVQDITVKAGINRTTFYLHFPDKYALLDYSVGRLFHQELEKRTLNLCSFSPDNLRSLIVTVAEFFVLSNAHCSHAEPQFETLVEAQVKQQVQALLQVWIEKADRNGDARTAAIAASWAIYGLAQEWGRDKKRLPAEIFSRSISDRIEAILGLVQAAPAP